MDRRAWQTAVHGVTHKELDKTEQLTLSLSLMCVCMCVSLCVCVCVCVCIYFSLSPTSLSQMVFSSRRTQNIFPIHETHPAASLIH